MRIKQGDTVKLIAGSSRGKTGKILRVLSKEKLVTVEGANLRKKHTRPRKQGQKGQVIEFPAPVNMSNVMLVCPKCLKTTRISATRQGDKKKRMCKKCKAVID